MVVFAISYNKLDNNAITLMLRTGSLIDLSAKIDQIKIDYNEVNNNSNYSSDSNKKYSPNFYWSFIQVFSQLVMPLSIILKIILSTDLSTSTSPISIEYDEIDEAGGKSVEKLLKIWKTLKTWKFCKSHWSKEIFTKTLVFYQLDTKNSSFY